MELKDTVKGKMLVESVFESLLGKGLIRLALMNLDKLNKPPHAKSYIVDTSPKCAEYIFQKNGCSSFLIRCCLKES